MLADFDEEEFYPDVSEQTKDMMCKQMLRHELIHAFLFESGLNTNTFTVEEPWSINEELVDWVAIQFPKMYNIFKELGCL